MLFFVSFFLFKYSFCIEGGGDLKNESRGFYPVHDYIIIVLSIEGEKKKKTSWKYLYIRAEYLRA